MRSARSCLIALLFVVMAAGSAYAGPCNPSRPGVKTSSKAGCAEKPSAVRLASAAPENEPNSENGKHRNKITLAPVVVRAPRVEPSWLTSNPKARRQLERTPGAVAQVDQSSISRHRTASLSDVLQMVPGVSIGARRGAIEDDQISIRGSGLESRYDVWGINVLENGFSLNQADGLAVIQPIDPDFLRRIEIYKGASALRFGGDTMGGAINLITKTGYDVPPIEVRSTFGSYGFMKNYVGLGHVSGRWDSYLGLSDTELGGYREHDIQAQRRLVASLGYTNPSVVTARLDLSYLNDSEDLPGELTRSELIDNPTLADPSYVSAQAKRSFNYVRSSMTVSKPIGEDQMIEGFAQFYWHGYNNPLPFAIVEGSTYAWSGEVRYVNLMPVLGHANRITAGMQYGGTMWKDLNWVNENGSKGTKLRDQWDRALSLGWYAEDDFDLTHRLTLVIGGRVDYSRRSVSGFSSPKDFAPTGVADFVSGLSPKVGFLYRLMAHAQLFGNISRAYQPPILKEEEALNNNRSVSDLRAERGWQFETGARGRWRGRLRWNFAAYDYEIHNEILNFNKLPYPGAKFTIPSYINVPRTRHVGIEFGIGAILMRDISRRLGIGAASDHLSGQLAYTWSHFRFVGNPSYGDNQIPGLAPENRINAQVTYSNKAGYWVQPYVYAVPDGWAVNSPNTVFAPAYTLVGVRLGYNYSPWHCRFFFDARNLTDTSWAATIAPDEANQRFFDPGDGRSFYGGVSWHL